MFRLLKWISAACFVLALLVVGSVSYWFLVPPDQAPGKTLVEIPDGASFTQVTHLLDQHKVIRWPLFMLVYGRLSGADSHVRTGVYEFSQGILSFEVMEKIKKGTVMLTEFSHPPGYNMWQVAERLHEKFPKISVITWLQAFADPKLVNEVAPGAANLEGYLFPDVYRIRSNANAIEVVRMMTLNFKRYFTPELAARGKRLGLTPHETITLASIIEKETGASSERPLIASVFFNRMKKHMRLQTDPTVIYGIWDKYDGNLHRSDLETPTPYNTYTISGLPPGPIANAGLEAILAAISPTSVPYLYFVAKGNGTHYFSQTLTEHSNAVRRFQILPHQRKK